MAEKIKAIGTYSPKIIRGRTVKMDELVSYIASRTGLNEGEISLVLKELRDAIVFFNLVGRSVKLKGLGIYSPKINLDGIFGVGHRVDNSLKNRINAPGQFQGEIKNRDMIGKTLEELFARWNEEHPDDPIS